LIDEGHPARSPSRLPRDETPNLGRYTHAVPDLAGSEIPNCCGGCAFDLGEMTFYGRVTLDEAASTIVEAPNDR
jgi:hypothetical protein